jgi:hypothetical protein
MEYIRALVGTQGAKEAPGAEEALSVRYVRTGWGNAMVLRRIAHDQICMRAGRLGLHTVDHSTAGGDGLQEVMARDEP